MAIRWAEKSPLIVALKGGFFVVIKWRFKNYLNPAIASADVVIEKSDQYLVFVRKDGEWYFSVVKSSDAGNVLWLTSFRKTNEGDVRREMKRGTVKKNELLK